jgi:hypothetical protein
MMVKSTLLANVFSIFTLAVLEYIATYQEEEEGDRGEKEPAWNVARKVRLNSPLTRDVLTGTILINDFCTCIILMIQICPLL